MTPQSGFARTPGRVPNAVVLTHGREIVIDIFLRDETITARIPRRLARQLAKALYRVLDGTKEPEP